jgi:3-oxoacyl-[acyl-carrier-protein] synthase II
MTTASNGKVVVTGAGVIAPIGAGIEDFERQLYAGSSALLPNAHFAETTVGEVPDFTPQTWLGNKGLRVLDRTARLLCVAAQMALCRTGLSEDRSPEGDPSLGLIYGTMFGSMRSITSFDWTCVTEGPSNVSPMEFPNTVISSPGGQAAIKHGLRGVNSTICGGLASGLHALNCAAEFLKCGRARALLAGGAEELCQEALFAFHNLGLLSASSAIRPFAPDRSGTALGEGSALLLLESEGAAGARGALPLLEVCGFGEAQDESPTEECGVAAIRQALRNSAIDPGQIACIVASANGTLCGDEAEARALQTVFGSQLREIPVCAPKAAFGEAMGASGAFCALVAGLALMRQSLPPTANHSGAGFLALSAQAQQIRGEYALVNAFSYDGNATSLVLRLWKN